MLKKYCLKISISVLFASVTFFSCETPPPPNLDAWVGNYIYEEDPVAASDDFMMVMAWDLAISKNAKDKYIGTLNVNGQQTAMTIIGDVVGDPQAIAFVYSDTTESVGSTFQPGDTLFMLKKANNVLTTQWKAATPRLRENPPMTCNCFH